MIYYVTEKEMKVAELICNESTTNEIITETGYKSKGGVYYVVNALIDKIGCKTKIGIALAYDRGELEIRKEERIKHDL